MEGQVGMLQNTVHVVQQKKAIVIQQHLRGYLQRRRLSKMIAATSLIQRRFRAHLACSMPASWQPLDWEGFVFGKVLGQASALVQEATANGWMVAVKSPKPEFRGESAHDELRHELRVLELCQHPKVVMV
eukprot:s463_g23.t1